MLLRTKEYKAKSTGYFLLIFDQVFDVNLHAVMFLLKMLITIVVDDNLNVIDYAVYVVDVNVVLLNVYIVDVVVDGNVDVVVDV